MRASILPLLVVLLACRRDATVPASSSPASPPHASPQGASPAVTTARPATAPAGGGSAALAAGERGPAKAPVVVRDRSADQLWNVLGNVGLTPHSAVVARRGALRFTANGEVAVDGGGVSTFDPHQVVAREGDRVQLLVPALGSAVPLLLWADAADLSPQLARAAVLHADARLATTAEDGAVTLAAGEFIDVLDRKGAAARVRAHEGTLTGWIDAAALDVVFEPGDFELPAADAFAKAGTAVLRRPGGKAVYTLPTGSEAETVRVLQQRKGWLRIEYVQPCHEGVHVQGWVPSARVERVDPMGTGYGCGSAGGLAQASWAALESAPTVELAEDTALLDERGALVGRTRRAVGLRRGPDGRLRVATLWGLVAVDVENAAPATAR